MYSGQCKQMAENVNTDFCYCKHADTTVFDEFIIKTFNQLCKHLTLGEDDGVGFQNNFKYKKITR